MRGPDKKTVVRGFLIRSFYFVRRETELDLISDIFGRVGLEHLILNQQKWAVFIIFCETNFVNDNF